MKRFILGISGASGQAIGVKLLRELLERNFEVHLAISRQSLPILEQETGIKYGSGTQGEKALRGGVRGGKLFYYDETEMSAPIASGSFRTEAMFIAPCSMKTLSAVANGYASNLLERAADVKIKEGGKLILSPREMPFSAIHLENMLKLARLGVTIAPPVAAFYHGPRTIEAMVEFFAGKLLDQAGIENNAFKRWRG
ncbi:MAG: UbiX family flavin prenyltransferase [Nitrospiraceae bacterium]|nr:UbiX family flavin prenyltransferase [Nitrospiraceae bacterium]MDA8324939.1 UbiX family flavin prenyltransferase [Nitrospiraceae bacterium]